MGIFTAVAGENATLISSSVPAGTTIMPRTIFTETWTFQNTGTTTWTPGDSGCTLNLIGKDSLGAIPTFINGSSTWYTPSAIIGSGKSVPTGGQGSFTLTFIAPETPGSVSDTFQLNDLGGTNFGPQVTIQITVAKAGSTNEYDRARAVSYANNYAGYVNSDGYFWTNGSSYGTFTPGSPAPKSGLGDDCAHFVSCCIGSQPAQWGGGLSIPGRVPPTYGEPGAGRLINTVLIGGGYAMEVFSLNDLEPGDLIGWNWEGDTNIANIDHVTLYVGNGMLAAHSSSALDVSATTWYQNSESGWEWHLIHILDLPTLGSTQIGNKLIMSWGTNWAGYGLYSSSSMATNATWTKVSASPVKSGTLEKLTNTVSTSGSVFYRLMHP